jgi:hypothetical protein
MIKCTWFESNYNNTCQSSENVIIVMQVLKKKRKNWGKN